MKVLIEKNQIITLWYNVESSDGYGSVTWFLKQEHAEKYNEEINEALSDNIYSAETFKGSDIHESAIENSKEFENKHEYLTKENYYEVKEVGTGARSTKTCEQCGRPIPKGVPHDMHHFYPEFYAYPTHKECSKKFKDSLN